MKLSWLTIRQSDLETEYRQLNDEGRDVSSLEDEFEALRRLDLEGDLRLQHRAWELMDRAQELPMREDYPFREPSDLESIRAERPEGPRQIVSRLSNEDLFDR